MDDGRIFLATLLSRSVEMVPYMEEQHCETLEQTLRETLERALRRKVMFTEGSTLPLSDLLKSRPPSAKRKRETEEEEDTERAPSVEVVAVDTALPFAVATPEKKRQRSHQLWDPKKYPLVVSIQSMTLYKEELYLVIWATASKTTDTGQTFDLTPTIFELLEQSDNSMAIQRAALKNAMKDFLQDKSISQRVVYLELLDQYGGSFGQWLKNQLSS